MQHCLPPENFEACAEGAWQVRIKSNMHKPPIVCCLLFDKWSYLHPQKHTFIWVTRHKNPRLRSLQICWSFNMSESCRTSSNPKCKFCGLWAQTQEEKTWKGKVKPPSIGPPFTGALLKGALPILTFPFHIPFCYRCLLLSSSTMPCKTA